MNNKHNYQPCGCNSSQDHMITNFFNPSSQNSNGLVGCHQTPACNNCIDIYIAKCLVYTGPNLLNLGINTNDNFEIILKKLDDTKKIQDQKNTKLLQNINDLNTRLNTEAGGTPHPPYTLL